MSVPTRSLAEYVRLMQNVVGEAAGDQTAAVSSGSSNQINVVEQQQSETLLDDHTQELENRYRFSDGVVIKQSIEHDLQPANTQACEECWITYEVLDGAGQHIQPQQKHFYNRCQQTFWLRMQVTN